MISVLLSVYKEKNDYINQSILSILNQTYGDFELIIIIDNPSNEDAISLIKDLASKDKRIHFYINEENMGLVKSLNRALSYAKGEYIARMDADDMSMPNRFEICKEYLENNNLDLIGGVYEHMDEEGHVVPNSRTYGYSPSQVEKIIKYTNIIPHPTWFGKKEVFDSLNGYRLVKYAEDYDFLLRACEKGYRLGVIDEKVLNYRIFH